MLHNTEFPNLEYRVEDLIIRLEANLTKHIYDVSILKEARLKEAGTKLADLMHTLKTSNKVEDLIQFPEIDDNSEKYIDAIEMLKLTTFKEIELDVQQFRKLVLDKWDFSNQLSTLKIAYGV